VLLPNDIGKLLRTVFAGQDLVAHGEVDAIIRDARRYQYRGKFTPSPLLGAAFGFTLLLA
jgi:hypothetical protein